MRYNISSRIFFPSMSARPARVVGVKLASVAWAAVLIAVGLDPTAVTADDGHAAAVTALRGATDVLAIGAGTKGRAASKAGPALLALHGEYQIYLQVSDAHARGPSGFTSRNPLARIAEGYVVVDTAAEGDPKALASELEALGLEDPAVFGPMVSGRLPLAAIPALEDLASLRFARPAYAMTLVGSVTSQGDAAMRADIARSTFGVDGTGVTVGALSDSFNCLGGAAAGVTSGDLPAGIVVLEEIGDCTGATDEGAGARRDHPRRRPGGRDRRPQRLQRPGQFRPGHRRSRQRRRQGDHRRCHLLRRADVPGRHRRPGGRPGKGARGQLLQCGGQPGPHLLPVSVPTERHVASISASARRRRTTSIPVPASIPASRSPSPVGGRSDSELPVGPTVCLRLGRRARIAERHGHRANRRGL